MPDSSAESAKHAAAAEGLNDVSSTETVHHESRSKGRRASGRSAELNLTAMLDVCFQLLIFFVLTASFSVGEGILPADLPQGESQAESDEPPPTQPINISLRSLGGGDVAIELAGDPSPPGTFQELYQKLQSMQVSDANPTAPFNPDDPVIIEAEGSVEWTHLVNAFNAAVRARYSNVNFAQPSN